MTDINERMVDEWVESTTARERIKEILEETTTYSKVSAIADRARVSEPTTRKYLNELVEEGSAPPNRTAVLPCTNAIKVDSSIDGSKNCARRVHTKNWSRPSRR